MGSVCKNGFSTAAGGAKCWLAMKERRNEREKARFLSSRYLGVSGFGGEKSVPEDTALTGWRKRLRGNGRLGDGESKITSIRPRLGRKELERLPGAIRERLRWGS